MGKRRRPAPIAEGKKPQKQQQKKKAKYVPDSDEDVVADFFEQAEVSSDDEGKSEGEKEVLETVHEKKVRLAKEYLDRVKESVAAEEVDDEDDENARDEAGGRRDTIVADILRQEQLEESGRVQRDLASRVLQPQVAEEGRFVARKHRQSVTAVALSDDDKWGFSASKDGLVLQWDVETGASYKFSWPDLEAMKGLNRNSKGAGNKRPASKRVFSIAVDSSGRYLATGGPDRNVHLWDVRTRTHIQVFPGHRDAVSSLAFRQGTSQLISGSYDRTIKLWSADDRSYLETLFGHQSEVLAVDCLRQERVLSTGRDRTARIWKVPEESQLVFRGQAPSLESCCFITNSEFLSGSDDGSVALWSAMKKKPVFVCKHAHGPSEASAQLQYDQSEENTPTPKPSAIDSWVGAVASCRGSNLAASGAADGKIQLWALEEERKKLRPLHSLPATGFVNAMAFARSGSFLVAAMGQEHRLGRWGRNGQAKNGVLVHNIDLS